MQEYGAEYGSNARVHKLIASKGSMMSNCLKDKYEGHFAIDEQKSSRDENQDSHSDQKDSCFEDSIVFAKKKRSTIGATHLQAVLQASIQPIVKDLLKPQLIQKPFNDEITPTPSINFFSRERRSIPETPTQFKIDFHRNNFFDLMLSQRKQSKESKDSNSTPARSHRGADEIQVIIFGSEIGHPKDDDGKVDYIKQPTDDCQLNQTQKDSCGIRKPSGNRHRSESEPWTLNKLEFINQCGSDSKQIHKCKDDRNLDKSSQECLSPEVLVSDSADRSKFKTELISKINSFKSRLPQLPDLTLFLQPSAPVHAFAANSYKGLTRESNEDRIVAHFNIKAECKDSKNDLSSKATGYHLISLFDGHSGVDCVEFLAKFLHQKLIEELLHSGISHPAFGRIYDQLDKNYLDHEKLSSKNYSGSCACTLIILERRLVVLNVGDSRCILSMKGGQEVMSMTNDHKPDRISELIRIFKNGGIVSRVFRNIKSGRSEVFSASSMEEFKKLESSETRKSFVPSGPWRVSPMKISVSRAFGDRGAKDRSVGGQPGVITSKPEISEHQLENCDFALLACKLIS